MTVNIKVLKDALKAIETFPEYHDQDSWIGTLWEDLPDSGQFPVQAGNGDHPPCGTTLCQAGWIAFQQAPAGSKLAYGKSLLESSVVVLPDGTRDSIAAYAQEAAGLTDEQADALFHGARSYEELSDMIAHLETDPGADRYDLLVVADIY